MMYVTPRRSCFFSFLIAQLIPSPLPLSIVLLFSYFVIPLVFLLLGLWLVLRKFEKTPRLTREQIAGLILVFVVALISMG